MLNLFLIRQCYTIKYKEYNIRSIYILILNPNPLYTRERKASIKKYLKQTKLKTVS